VPLNGINSQFNESDPGIIPDNILIFASDRPGGNGGLDLYASQAKLPEIQKAELAEEEIFIETFISSLNVKKYENITLVQFPYTLSQSSSSSKYYGNYQLTGTSALNFDLLYISSWNLVLARMSEFPNSKLFIGPCDTIASLLRTGSLEKNQTDPVSAPQNKLVNLSNIMAQAESLGISKRIYPIHITDKIRNFCIASDSPELLEPIRLGEARYELEPPFLEFILNFGSDKPARDYECRLSLNGKVFEDIDNLKFPDTLRIDLTKYSNDVFSSDSLTIEIILAGDSTAVSKSLKLSITKNNLEDLRIYQVGDKKFERYLFYVPDESLLDLRQYYGSLLNQVNERLNYAKSVMINYFSDNEQSRNIASRIGYMIKSGNQKTQKPINQAYLKKSEILTFSESFRPFLFQVLLEK
jgi:hypothetical protein